ncbi:sigma-70 family RNA polymerase sigma factor [Phenylobacterium sp.]|uniref:sigma-70 family RNA polymerase sigma factor n=1 Tax=Phenylobacterium sp. TaxID=1871053 RepID=UPI00398378A5
MTEPESLFDAEAQSPFEPPSHSDEPANWIVAIGRDRDRGAFASLFARFAPKLKSYLLRLGLSDQFSEELAQDTLLTVWRKAALFDPRRASAAGWIYAIARNLRIDMLRREHRPFDLRLAEPVEDAATPEQNLRAHEGELRVRSAMECLPREQAEVLRLAFFEEQSHTEIAERLSLPLGTVKSRIRRASAQLRTALDDLA